LFFRRRGHYWQNTNAVRRAAEKTKTDGGAVVL